MKPRFLSLIIISAVFMMTDCTTKNDQTGISSKDEIKGKLFIIGGGNKSESLIKEMVHIAGVDTGGYVILLPMSSNETDTAIFYGLKQFTEIGIVNVRAYNIQSKEEITQNILDSVMNASLIYISGGDQNMFMEKVFDTELYNAMHLAYKRGAMIAGTSAGAAVMSKKMITGNENKHPEYTGYFRTIEANNIEIGVGMGFLENIIIDQHFVKRMRMNRLISVCLENPENECIGIDESTALLVIGNKVKVFGESQVIVLNHTDNETKIFNGLLGAKNISMDIYLPGDTFFLTK